METRDKSTPQEPTLGRYEQPKLTDYGTLVDLTAMNGFPNGDVPGGVNNAFS